MRRLPVLALTFAFPVCLGLARLSAPAAKTEFQPPQPVSVSDVAYPPQSIAVGTVVLRAEVGESGDVKGVTPVRPIASLTEEAVRAVQEWKFKPATLKGKAVASLVTVAVTFNPAVNKPADIPLPPAEAGAGDTKEARYTPPGIAAASFPEFPLGGMVYGSVALDVSVSANGEIGRVAVLRDIVSLTNQAEKAVKKWKFTPAQYDGRPMRASVVLAFVFRFPATNSR